ncbi:hypothetical protein [Actinomyces sp. oral taxon 170]|uniref:LppM family (lipo)protein n=1 Tax=Actinomyces sp. oral taxon 170 TaxID=712117 RepID=UPI00054E38A6|nr:hypothetical protein [Actinomyces sp. oral taxon 170]
MNEASRNVPRPVVAAVLAALTLILAGCGVRYDFVIHDNETADMTYIMWDSSNLRLISKENCTEKELGKSTPLPEGVEANYTYTSHNGNPACQVTAKAVPLNKLQTDTWTIKHKDGQYIFDLSPGSLNKLSAKNPQLSSQNVGGNTKVSVSVTFPGEVTKSNGRSNGNKVTWDDALESSDGLHAEGEDGKFHLQWWMVAIASGIVLLIVAGVVLYLLRVQRAQRMSPVSPYGEVPQDPGMAGTHPSDVYISGPYQSPLPGAQQPTPGPTQTYPVANLQDGYSPYVDPGAGAGAFPPQDAGYAGQSAGPGIYGAQDGNGTYAPGPGYTQMPYQQGHSQADFQPPQERTGGGGQNGQYYPPYQGG